MSRCAWFFLTLCSLLVIFSFLSIPVLAQCSFPGAVSSWTDGSGNWSNSGSWNNGVPNSSGTSVCINNGTAGAPSVVNLDMNASINDLQLGSYDTLNFNLGTQLVVYGTQIVNDGQINVNGGGGANTYLYFANNTTLSGAGTLTLSTASGGGEAYLEQLGGNYTLTNESTIQGAGYVGNNGLSLINSGTVNANSAGQALYFNSMNGFSNTGLLEASNGGYLQIGGGVVVNNAGGNITANAGSNVQFFGSAYIEGGTLNNNGGAFLGTPVNGVAYLDGTTQGAITINGTYTNDLGSDTYLYGTIHNQGNLQINGGSGNNTYLLVASNLTLDGGGTLTLSTTGSSGAAYIEQAGSGRTLENVNNTIQGAGYIGVNSLSLVNDAQGVINANSVGRGLELYSLAGVVNEGLMEASNGGYLELNGVGVNNAGGNITANAGSYVQFFGNTTIEGGTLNNNGGAFLGTSTGGVAFLDGTTQGAITINGTYTSDYNTDTYLYGTIHNQGNLQINGGSGNNTYLLVGSNLTLDGEGTVTLSTVAASGGSAYIEQSGSGQTLENVNNTIQGAGIIGNNGLSLVNDAQGIINANAAGQGLELDSMTNGVVNHGLMEASNGGYLQLYGVNVLNAGANITANAGSYVQLFGSATIQGGTITNNGLFFGVPSGYVAVLDGSTAGAITLNGTYTSDLNTDTYLLGTINNHGNIQLNGGNGTYTYLYIDSNNLTLQGGGTVTLSSIAASGGEAIIEQSGGGRTLENVDNLIQGAGVIGNNGLTLLNDVNGVINANSTGSPQIASLTIQSAPVTNTGLMEATNNGVLNLYGDTVNNAGGMIAANGSGASVYLYGNTDIQGGTLNNNGGAFFGTPQGQTAYLDGSTAAGAITINGTYTSDLNTDTYFLGTINNRGGFQLNGGSGNYSYLLIDSPNVTLQGGGTVTLSSIAASGGEAIIEQSGGGRTLENVNNTIQGSGLIGNNGLTLLNDTGGVINANFTSGAQIASLTIQSAPVTNVGLMEATNNGALALYADTINNAGGTITANGAGASVYLYGNTDIQGGTLNNNGGAFFGTPQGQVAYLDGSTAAGAVTIKGTYTSGLASQIFLLGTFNNQGNIQVNGGSGNYTYLYIDSNNVTLQGGGTVTLATASGGGVPYIQQAGGGRTLENLNDTIQGAGVIGNNGLSLLNDAGGTILANAPGQNLYINGGGTLTNNGTFQANAGSALVVQSVNFTNFSGNTLTGGTYNVYGTSANAGTLEIDPLGHTGGEIVNNAATILLSGPNSNFVDSAGLDALSNFSNNEAGGSFTIENGRNFTGPANTDFTNAGTVNIGSGSTFTTAGTGNYVQSGGMTQLDGVLTTGGGQANFDGGTLYGNGGTISGNVMMAGTIVPAAAINGFGMPLAAGLLNINGNYTQTAAGIFNLGIGGLAQGTQFGFLNVTGNALLNGTLDISLLNGFMPTVGETFEFITTGGSVNNEFATVNGLNIGNGDEWEVVYGPNYVELEVEGISGATHWLGGPGNWSNNGGWSSGTPTVGMDATIYSGGADLVTLDQGTEYAKSLTLGGASNGFTSELTDNGTAQNLTIAGFLNVGQQGALQLIGGSTATAGADSSNAGHIYLGNASTLSITGNLSNTGFLLTGNFNGSAGGNHLTVSGVLTNGGILDIFGAGDVASVGMLINTQDVAVGTGATLNLTNQPNGITDAVAGSQFAIAGTFTAGGNPGFANLNSVEGEVYLNGQSFTITPGSGTLTISSTGSLGVDNNPTTATPTNLTISGDVNNSGLIFTGSSTGAAANTLDITGKLTNGGTFQLLGSGDQGTIGSLTNNAGGFVDVEHGSTLTVNGDVTNNAAGPQGIYTSFNGTGDNTIDIGGTLTNNGKFGLESTGDSATVTGAVTNNNGGLIALTGGSTGTFASGLTNNLGAQVDLENGSKLTIDGAVSNNGTLSTSGFGGVGGNTLNITGLLTNSGTVQLNGNGDMATIGNLTNQTGGQFALSGSTATVASLLNNGAILPSAGSVLTVTGNADNFGTIGIWGGGGSTVNIAGTLTNETNFEPPPGTIILWGTTLNAANVVNYGLLDFEEGGTLTVTGDVNNPGTIATGSFLHHSVNALTIDGTLTNSGSTQLEGADFTATIGTLTNSGSGSFSVSGPFTAVTIGSVSNSANGSIDLDGASVTITGDVNNAGTLQTSGGNTISVGGLLTNAPTGIISVNGSMDMLQALAGIVNSGTINVNNSSTIDPPFFNNLGTLNIDRTSTFVVGTGAHVGSGYIQLANGILGEMIASNSSFGVINVNGSALLNGTLDILLQGGFNPAVGSTFKFLVASANGINGQFSSIENDIFNDGTEMWAVDFFPADGYVELIAEPNQAPLPEPGVLLVLIPGLLGAGFVFRRPLFR